MVLSAINNLRSLVSRHALVCIGDMFKYIGKLIEPHLDEILLKVLKKYNESSNFLEKELDRAMSLMLLNVSETRAVGVLLLSVNNKSAAIRVKIAFFLANLIDILVCFVIFSPMLSLQHSNTYSLSPRVRACGLCEKLTGFSQLWFNLYRRAQGKEGHKEGERSSYCISLTRKNSKKSLGGVTKAYNVSAATF